MLDIKIRDEAPSDVETISTVTQEAFRGHPYSQQTEAGIIAALRDANALTLSLVAEYEDRIVGHIAFSPVSISDGSHDWYGMGPLSVIPDLQGQGIGSTLVRYGLERLGKLGGKGCVVVGEAKYYKRFGFQNNPDLVHEGIPGEVFLALSFGTPSGPEKPHGAVMFHSGFSAQ